MNDLRKAYLSANAKAETLALNISHALGCTDAFRDSTDDTWDDVGVLNSIATKLEEVLQEVKMYEKLRTGTEEY